jgi:hypothetical protein
VIKQHAQRHLVGILRRVRLGSETLATQLRAATQASDIFNTAWIERLNGTFRARITALVRRGRSLARDVTMLHQATYLTGTVYNFCTPHTTLSRRAHQSRTPAMAAGITDHCWSVQDLLAYPLARPHWVAVPHRGRGSRAELALMARWCA